MKRIVLAFLLLGALPLARGAEATTTVTFYVQLIRASDADAPPTPQAHLIGSKLDHRLHDIFRWKNYWEIKRETVALHMGSKVRKRMSPQQEIELAWPGAHEMTVSMFSKGKLTRRRAQSVDATFYIAGGETDAAEPWFIVVRRDNPDTGMQAAIMP